MRSGLVEADRVIRKNIHFPCLINFKIEEQQSSVGAEDIASTLSVKKGAAVGRDSSQPTRKGKEKDCQPHEQDECRGGRLFVCCEKQTLPGKH